MSRNTAADCPALQVDVQHPVAIDRSPDLRHDRMLEKAQTAVKRYWHRDPPLPTLR